MTNNGLRCDGQCKYHLPATETQSPMCRLVRQLGFKDPPSKLLKSATKDQILDLIAAWKMDVPDLYPFFTPAFAGA